MRGVRVDGRTSGPHGPDALMRVVGDIRSMRIRGASLIGTAAARALADHVQGLDGSPAKVLAGARKAARRLDAARPTAVTLHNSLGWVLQAMADAPTAAAMRRAARDEARRLARADKDGHLAIARNGARHLRGGDVVLTHCNSTASLAVLEQCARDGKEVEAIATETRPWRQGLLTVRALSKAGLQCALIVDSAVEHVLATRDIDLVLVGADAVARDGSLFNKVGTAGVAVLARRHDVPVHSAAGLAKFTRHAPDEVPIEERPAAEVVAPREVPRGVRVLNPVFDRTEPGLVSAYVTEDGLASPAQAVRRNLARLPPEEAWG